MINGKAGIIYINNSIKGFSGGQLMQRNAHYYSYLQMVGFSVPFGEFIILKNSAITALRRKKNTPSRLIKSQRLIGR